MTVQKDVTKNIYVGNGSTRTFPFTFECPAEHPEYIKVYLMQDDGTALATSDYQLDMDARQITYPSSGTALPEGKKLVIMRELPLQQMMNLVNNGPYFAEDVETAFDENVMAMQQIAEKLNRSIIMSVDIDGDAFVNEVPFEAGKSFRIADDGKSIVLTEDPGKVIDEAKGLAEETATNAQEAKQAAAEIKTIYNSGGLTPITDLAGSIGTAIKRWGYIFANKVFAMNLPIVYKSVAEMKADSLLSAGMTACTLGYAAPNDGGAGTYIIRAKADGDVDDGGSVHELANGCVAELVVENGTVCPEQFGAKGDGQEHIVNGIDIEAKAIKQMFNLKVNVIFGKNKSYKITQEIIIDGNRGLIFDGQNCNIIHEVSHGFCVSNTINGGNIACVWRAFNFISTNKKYNGIYVKGGENYAGSNYLKRCEITQCHFNGQKYGMYLGGYNLDVHHNYFINCDIAILNDCCNYSNFSFNYLIANNIGIQSNIPYYNSISNNTLHANNIGITIIGQEGNSVQAYLNHNVYKAGNIVPSRGLYIYNTNNIIAENECIDAGFTQGISIGNNTTTIKNKNIDIINCNNQSSTVCLGDFEAITINGGYHRSIIIGDYKDSNDTIRTDIIYLNNLKTHIVSLSTFPQHRVEKYLVMTNVKIVVDDDGTKGELGTNLEKVWQYGYVYIKGVYKEQIAE